MKFKNKLTSFVVLFSVLCLIDANIMGNRIIFEDELAEVRAISLKGFSSRIVSGTPLDNRTKWPWLVAFTRNEANNYFCCGSLFSKQHVLGAAHCFQQKTHVRVVPPEHVTAHLGKFNLSDLNEPGSKSSWVSQIIIHPEWNPQNHKYDADITIVVLGEEVEFSEFIQPVSLPPQSKNDVIGSGTIAGWGQSTNSIEFNGNYEKTPIELEMPVVNSSFCYPRFPDLAHMASGRMFCAGYDSETKGACSGDSGGGFYVLDSLTSSKFQVKGIVSSSLLDENKVCDVNKFSLYTNVGWFVEWIKDKMKETKEWTQVELKCIEDPKFKDVNCHHSFTGPFKQNMKISSTPKFTSFSERYWNADEVDKLMINFGNSTHIFSGMGKTFQNLKKLWIYGRSIKFIKRHDFANLLKLKELRLASFNITFIPEDIFSNLPALETLLISFPQLQTLPPKLFSFSNNLIELEIYGNKELTHVSNDLFKTAQKLKKLRISSSTNFKLVKSSFWNLPELEELRLNYLNLSRIPENLVAFTRKLKKLDLSYNKLEKLDEKFKEKIPQLEVLKLAENPIELSETIFIGLSKLKELSLWNCGLKTLLLGIFDSLTYLEELNLGQNQLRILTENIFVNNLNLKKISLRKNELTVLTANIFARNVNLKSIDLRLNKLRYIDFKFTKLQKIEEIILIRNECINDRFGRGGKITLSAFQNAINSKCHR